MYTIGKQIIDMIDILNIKETLSQEDKKYLYRFKETRNKIVEH